MYDVAIVGGGPAGASAATFTARAGLQTVVVDADAGMTRRAMINNHLGFPEGLKFLKPGKQTEVLDSGNPIVPPPHPLPDQVDAKLKGGFSPEQKVVLVAGGMEGRLLHD